MQKNDLCVQSSNYPSWQGQEDRFRTFAWDEIKKQFESFVKTLPSYKLENINSTLDFDLKHN